MHVPLRSRPAAQCMNMQQPHISLHSFCPRRSRHATAYGKQICPQRAQQPHARSWTSHARRVPIACASAATDQVYKAISDNQEATITVVTGTQLVQEVRKTAVPAWHPWQIFCLTGHQLPDSQHGRSGQRKITAFNTTFTVASCSCNPVLCAPCVLPQCTAGL
jgi:hypothetical protein